MPDGWSEAIPIAIRTGADGYCCAPPILRHYGSVKLNPPIQPFNFAIQAMLTFKFLWAWLRSIVRPINPGIAEETEPDGGSSKICLLYTSDAADE